MIPTRKRFRAQSLVEFALVAPLFFLLVFGLIEGARLAWTYNTLTNATKEGSRYALVHGARSGDPASSADVKDHMLDHSTGLSSGNLTVVRTWIDADDSGDNENDPGDKVRIETSYRHTFVVGYIFGTDPIDLTASSEAMIAY